MKYFLSIAIAVISIGWAMAQNADWVEMMEDPNVNFYSVQSSFEEYWKDREIEKGKGWKQFKRWEAFMEPRVYPEGVRPDPSILATEYATLKAKQNSSVNAGSWSPLGPFDGNALNGVGRINKVTLDPANNQVIWVGTPAGGLWKSVDGGLNWSTNTDLLPNLGVTDIDIDPSNPNVMYLATGDRDGSDTYSYGILKSTDGGVNWNATGLSYSVTQQIRISNVIIHPTQTNTLIATTSAGIQRSTDGGATWSNRQNGVFNALVQKPGNPNVLFATSSSRVYRSTDNGLNWAQIQNAGLPTSGIRRIELAVTPHDPDYVYALYGASNNGYLGLYRSTDSGNNWNVRSTAPNLLGWSSTGSDNGGQAWYDLALAVNPTNKNDVVVGGVNVWRSSNGGNVWNIIGHWQGNGAAFIHADIHHLSFTPDGASVYAGCDGGIYRKNDNQFSWDELNVGMNITQYYKLGASVTDPDLIIVGAQDNGTDLYDNNTWDGVRGGDGMECAIDPRDGNIMYSSVYYGNFRKSTNRGNNFNANFNLSASGSGNWITPFLIDPLHPDTLYAGFSRVYRSDNGGISFSAVSPSGMTGGSNLDQMALSPTHTNVLYVSEGSRLWRSDNHGSSFTSLSVPGSREISYISVAYDDPMHVFITRSGYTAGQKVYESKDGGASWTNISANLPNIPANCVAIENNGAVGVYAGTDLGVFYRDKNSSEWLPYNNNLPNVIVTEIEINYTDRQLKMATYGRGLWQSPLYSDLVAPLAEAGFPSLVCSGDTVTLTDLSHYHPTSRSWNIIPGTFTYVNGTSASSPNPQLIFNQPGIYDIELTASNSLGTHTRHYISAVASGGFPLPFTEDFEAANSFDHWSAPSTDQKGWERTTVTGNNPGGFAARSNLYFNTGNGPYELISPGISFVGHSAVSMDFDYAYRGRGGNTDDTLRVYIATQCQSNWVLLKEYYEDGTSNFVTSTPRNSDFIPGAPSDWCGNPGFGDCKTLDLSAYDGMEGIRIKFEVGQAGGNNVYLDNINITGNSSQAPTAAFSGPGTTCALRNITLTDQSYGSPATYEWTFTGGNPAVSNSRNPSVSYAAAGTYEVKLKVSNSLGSDSITKTSFITVDPADSVLIALTTNNSSTLCYNDTLQLSLAVTNTGTSPVYEWYRNGSLIHNGSTSAYSYTGLQDGDFVYARVRSSLECSFPQNAVSDTVSVNVFARPTVQINATPDLCVNGAPITLNASPSGGTFTGVGVQGSQFDPSLAGAGFHTVFYDYTDANGCVNSAFRTIRVDAPVSISFNGQSSFCEGESQVRLTSASPSGGVYSGAGVYSGFFYPDSVGPGSYQISYSFTLGSCDTVTSTTTIDVYASPAAPTVSIIGSSLQCDQAGFTYQWFLGSTALFNARFRNFTPGSSGMYRVRITDTNGCSTFSDPIQFNIGQEEFENVISFSVFPNPVKDLLRLELETSTAVEGSLVIFNNVGQMLIEQKLEKSSSISEGIDVSDLPAGLYVLTIEGKDIRLNGKFIIE